MLLNLRKTMCYYAVTLHVRIIRPPLNLSIKEKKDLLGV